MNGILPLWKPKGMTSHDCVMKTRRLLRTKKVGHTGTLDPEVEGVLPICIGEATKIVRFLTDTNKTYVAQVTLGTATDTDDSYGEIINSKDVIEPLSKQKIKNVLQLFKGEVHQKPPMYSAVKVKGKKLYEYARANEAVERPIRKVRVYEIALLEDSIDENSFQISVVCSKGTYIRTLCVDIGAKLGYPAHMSHLIRTQTGSVREDDTITFETIENAVKTGSEKQLLLPVSHGLTHLKQIETDKNTKQRILYGQKLLKPDEITDDTPFVFIYKQLVLGIYQIHPEDNSLIKPVRIINEEKV